MGQPYGEQFASFNTAYLNTKDRAKSHKLGAITLMAGYIRYTSLISFIDERIPKESHHNVTNGQSLAVIILLASIDCFESIRSSIQLIHKYPISSLLKLPEDVKPEHFNKDLFCEALSALFDYGLEKFSSEWSAHLISLLNEDLGDEGHLDTTAISTYHATTEGSVDEDEESLIVFKTCPEKNGVVKQPKFEETVHQNGLTYQKDQYQSSRDNIVAIKHGKSKDHRPDLPQIVIASIVDGMFGIPYTFSFANGNSSDKVTFAEIADKMLPQIKANNKKFKYLVADSAACTKEFFNNCMDNGCHVITRCPDNFELSKKHLVNLDFSKFQPIYSEAEREELADKDLAKVTGYQTTDVLFGKEVSVAVIWNKGLEQQKRKTIRRKADKEKQNLENLLSQKFKCKEDADAHLNKLISKANFCTIVQKFDETQEGLMEAVYDYKWHRASRGRPKTGESKLSNESLKVEDLATTEGIVVDHVRAVCEVQLNEEVIEQTIQSECVYVLVCTNVQANLSIREILERYKRNTLVESLWKLIKNKRISLSSLFIKKVSRIESFLFILSIGLTGCLIMQKKIRAIIKEHNIKIPTPDFTGIEKNITMRSMVKYMRSLDIRVIHPDKTCSQPGLQGVSAEVYVIHQCLGPEWFELIHNDVYVGVERWKREKF